MNPFLAMIIPMGGGTGIWGGGNVPMPTPPIHMPPGQGSGNPPGIWGGGNVPMPNPPIANVPGAPGYNPQPPGIWGGGNVPMPTPPIYMPGGQGGGFPSQPIAKPPDENLPGWQEVYVQNVGWVKMIKEEDVPYEQRKKDLKDAEMGRG